MIPKKNALEWIVFAVSLVLVLAVIGILLVSGTRGTDRPPQLRISVGEPAREADHYRVPVTVENSGDETVADLKVDVSLRSGSDIVEQSEFTLMFVPRRSRREGAALFQRDPRCCEIVARAVGFESP